MNKGRSIAIMCSGGDCAGMNPAIKHFTEHSLSNGIRPYGVSLGFAGLFRGEIKPLAYQDVSGILHCGGTILGSSRFPEFHQAEVRTKVKEQLDKFGIDSLIVLGGDGSFRAMELLHREHGISVAGIPATIDNDVLGTETALGVDTALNVIRHSLDQLRDTASSFQRAFVVETMGRNCGYLAIITALTSGAEVCIVPEVEYDLSAIEKRLNDRLNRGRNYLTAIVSEAIPGGAAMLKEMIQTKLKMSTRVTVLGHVQRGGCPTVRDRLIAFESIGCCPGSTFGRKSQF